MSSKQTPQEKQENERRQAEGLSADAPQWRFARMENTQPSSLRSTDVARAPDSADVIDKASFFAKAGQEEPATPTPPPPVQQEGALTNWSPKSLRPVPAFYPLEKSSRFIDDDLTSVATRLSDCLRVLSVHAMYNDETATASLTTGENVEMHLSLWKTPGGRYPEGIVVELQRRRGDSISFHRYTRHILDAAIGDFDSVAFMEKCGGEVAHAYTKKAERMLKMQAGKTAASEEESAVIAIEIAHGLLMKDRMDARQLGLESLCLLTDPSKTGSTTAIIASRVILLGTTQGVVTNQSEGMMFDEAPFQEIRETILSLVQLRRIGDEEEFAVGDDDKDNCDSEDDFEGHFNQEKAHLSVLHNLALAVLANALDVIENYDSHDKVPEETRKPASRGNETASDIAASFMSESKDITSKEILSTLISELGRAEKKPHNACLSAKCLRCLCRASDDARRRAKELGAKNVVNTALDVGVRTHAKLETECKKVVKVLTATNNDEEEENGGDNQQP